MITTINPANEEVLNNYEELNAEQINEKLDKAYIAYQTWKSTDFQKRSDLMKNLARILREKKDGYAQLISSEMGKVLSQSYSEIEKCAMTAELYADEFQSILQNEIIETGASESYVSFEPIGIVLAVMPWNFPFWQALRFAIPTILAGNVGVLKHASMVQGSAKALEDLFVLAGFPEGVYQNLCIGSDKVEEIIKDDRVQAVTLTGSEGAGSKVASTAGSVIKKTVMELGGSDPYIILADADVKLACEIAVNARLRNNGQTCTSPKRFIVVQELVSEFTLSLVESFKAIKVGDPMDESSETGPLANAQIINDVEKQVKESVAKGAKLLFGGNRIDRKGFYFEPTILADVTKGMPAYDEEIFGPVASIITVQDTEDAIRVANDNRYGLGATLWTQNIEEAKKIAQRIEAGSVYINTMLSSDPRMPFGGIKKSGYGRELSPFGMREFVNIKTVWIK